MKPHFQLEGKPSKEVVNVKSANNIVSRGLQNILQQVPISAGYTTRYDASDSQLWNPTIGDNKWIQNVDPATVISHYATCLKIAQVHVNYSVLLKKYFEGCIRPG